MYHQRALLEYMTMITWVRLKEAQTKKVVRTDQSDQRLTQSASYCLGKCFSSFGVSDNCNTSSKRTRLLLSVSALTNDISKQGSSRYFVGSDAFLLFVTRTNFSKLTTNVNIFIDSCIIWVILMFIRPMPLNNAPNIIVIVLWQAGRCSLCVKMPKDKKGEGGRGGKVTICRVDTPLQFH